MSLSRTSVEVEGANVTVDKQIGEGAEGRIYSIKGNKSSVLKIFDEDVRKDKAPKVRAMLKDSNRPDDPAEGFHSIVWPQSEVKKSGEFIGYKMPFLDQDEWSKALVYQMKELANSSAKEQMRPAYNLSYMVHEIHKQGHALGDFNHDNIFVKDGYISLIDCDGFHINTQNRTFKGETFLPRYSPPEKRPAELDEVKEADKFCLGVHIFQFLMEGYHPYQAKGSNAVGGDFGDVIEENHFPYSDSSIGYEPPEEDLQQKYDKLPEEIQELFEQCFSKSSTTFGWARPSATKWARTLGRTDTLDIPESKLPKSEDTGGGVIVDGDDDDADLTDRADKLFDDDNSDASSNKTTDQTEDGDDDDADLTDRADKLFDDDNSDASSNKTTHNTSNSEDEEEDLEDRAEGIFGGEKESK